LKVAWFSPHFSDGGVERTILLLARKFIENNHQADLVSLNIKSEMLRSAHDDLRVVELGSSRSILSIRKLAAYLKREQPDALISAQHYANVIAILAKKLARSKTTLVITERVATKQVLRRDPPLKRLVLSQLMKRSFGSADSVVTNSKEGAKQLADFLGWPENRVTAIYNPTDLADIETKSSAETDHPWLDNPEIPVIISAGRLSHQKDYPTLIDAFSQVRKTHYCRLIILGDGPEKAALEDYIRNLHLESSIDLHQAVSNPFSYIAKASLFVLSSRYEGMPNALIEAQACNCPVVSTACETGPTELLLNGEAGALVPVGDAAAMARAIVDVLDNPAEAKNKVEIGRSNLDRFDSNLAYENYLALIEPAR